MTAVMQRLQSVIDLEPFKQIGEAKRWVFSEHLLNDKDTEFFRPLIKNHGMLQFEYNVLCAELAHDYFCKECPQEIKTDELVSALMMAELLSHIYEHYLIVPREVERLKQDQKNYREYLAQRGYYFNEIKVAEKKTDVITQFIRATTVTSNPFRLITLRSKRVINACVPLLENLEQFCHLVAIVDKYTNPAISYLSWIFFVPRLMTNLFLLFKHLFPGPWMDEKEKELGILTRLIGQLQRRWFELGNDSVWMIAGLLNCFVWLGVLAPVGVYVNVALFAYDVVLASIRAGIELSRLSKLKNEYIELEKKMLSENASPESLAEIRRLQMHLQEHIRFEQKRVLLTVGITSGLLLAVIIALPVFAISPVVPLIGAILLLAFTVANYVLGRLLDASRPQGKLPPLAETEKSLILAPQRLFSPSSRKIDDEEPKDALLSHLC